MNCMQDRQTVLFSATQTQKVSGYAIQPIQTFLNLSIGVNADVLSSNRLKILQILLFGEMKKGNENLFMLALMILK